MFVFRNGKEFCFLRKNNVRVFKLRNKQADLLLFIFLMATRLLLEGLLVISLSANDIFEALSAVHLQLAQLSAVYYFNNHLKLLFFIYKVCQWLLWINISTFGLFLEFKKRREKMFAAKKKPFCLHKSCIKIKIVKKVA